MTSVMSAETLSTRAVTKKRSDSPTQPTDEAANPVGAVGTTESEMTENKDMNANEAITAEMVKEEQELHEQTLKESEENDRSCKDVSITDDMKKARKNRLEFLLTKSNIYATFLVNRMKEQQKEIAAREERRKKKASKQIKKEVESHSEGVKKVELDPNNDSGNRRSTRNSPRVQETLSVVKKEKLPPKKGKKRKNGTLDDYLISDYIGETLTANKRLKTEEKSVALIESKIKQETKTEDKPKIASHVSDEDENGRYIKGEKIDPSQPELFNGGVLRAYQIEGYKWLSSLYENGVNGILADEMGLGKTIQCIALISHLVKLGVPGPFLVVAPLSTVPNWVSEFARFSPQVPVVLYHGSKEERNHLRKKIKPVRVNKNIKCMPVVITSYEIAMADCQTIQGYKWRLLIVDEGHRIKNVRCKLITALRLYESTHRLLLTGTPLQNNLAELWSLLNFLLPEIFDDLGNFEMWFDIDYLENDSGANLEIAADEQKNNVLSILHQILSPFMLRRMKTDVDLCIPPKREVMVYAPLSEQQQELYRTIVDKTIRYKVEEKPTLVVEYDENNRKKRRTKISVDYKLMLEDGKEDEKVKDKKKEEDALDLWIDDIDKHRHNLEEVKTKHIGPKSSIVKVQLRNSMFMLRKACNHPYLIEYPLTSDEQFKIDEDLVNHSGKLMLLDKMLKKLKENGHKVLIFSQMTQMLDILQDFCYLRDYKFCRLDGSYKLDERREQIDDFNKKPESFIFLLSTRAGGLGINLTAADTVVIFDSDWNPQSDLQAQDRCHRIGQTKPVMVYRLVTRNTVDQKIVERAAAKRKLEKLIIYRERFREGRLDEESLSKRFEPIDPTELIRMLEEKDYQDEVNTEVISDRNLEYLLDRSDLYKSWVKAKEADTPTDAEETDKTFADVKGVFEVIGCDMGNSA